MIYFIIGIGIYTAIGLFLGILADVHIKHTRLIPNELDPVMMGFFWPIGLLVLLLNPLFVRLYRVIEKGYNKYISK